MWKRIRYPLSQSQASSSGQLVSRTRKNDPNPYQELIAKGYYDGKFKLGKMTRYKFVRNLCPLMTTVEHYNTLYKFMREKNLIRYFIVYGGIELVRMVITGKDVQPKHFLTARDLYDALILSFHQKNHERFVGILVVLCES